MKKILIVDDQQGIRMLLSEVFKNEGFETLLASNGAEAVQIFENNMLDCVLLDMKIPGMHGLEILKKIKEVYADLPVIMMTGDSDKEVMNEAENCGADYFFAKPFNILEVRDTVIKIVV